MNKLKKHHAVMPQSALLSHVQRHLHKGPVLPASPPNLDAADDAGWKIVENQLWKMMENVWTSGGIARIALSASTVMVAVLCESAKV